MAVLHRQEHTGLHQDSENRETILYISTSEDYVHQMAVLHRQEHTALHQDSENREMI